MPDLLSPARRSRTWTSTDNAVLVRLWTLAGTPVVRMHGRLGTAAAAPARSAMEAALAYRRRTIVLDLGDCSHEDRTARTLILMMRRHAERHGVRLQLAGASSELVAELTRSGLYGLFDWSDGTNETNTVRSEI
ncbi:STAS domain-containing protein [Fodinicola acaciae]|uniref:STAS domain-containing protein n=1 Tax=Fodinicola acaciae TaxID=2681555 RepID=UPI0013D5DB0D|nr:STAS domain-containing protein [Fodinicola acaciae]